MSTKINILLIEDDADDIELLEEALRANKIAYSMEVIMDGDKVVRHLEALTSFPAVIVLDFNLPRVHGRDVLRLIKNSERYKHIPVIVLTTSAAKEDIDYSMKLGAAHFITKPTSVEAFAHTVATIASTAKAHLHNV